MFHIIVDCRCDFVLSPLFWKKETQGTFNKGITRNLKSVISKRGYSTNYHEMDLSIIAPS